MRLGAICVPVNARNKSHALRYTTHHAGIKILLASEEYSPLVAQAGPPEAAATSSWALRMSSSRQLWGLGR